jgi:murein DD-endopeptidase MepM/ murein hydrolase activator NlpD
VLFQKLKVIFDIVFPLLKPVWDMLFRKDPQKQLEQQNYWNDPAIDAEKADSIERSPVKDSINDALNSVYAEEKKNPSTPQLLSSPLKGLGRHVTSPYGERKLPGQPAKFHIGCDYGVEEGGKCIAIEDVIVLKVLDIDKKYPVRFKKVKGVWKNIAPEGSAWTPYVNTKSLRDPKLEYHYKHVRPGVKAGDVIKKGDVIGSCGNYGYSMGSHLHFEVWVNGNHTNPQKWFESMKKYFV